MQGRVLPSELVTLQMERCFLGPQCGAMLASALLPNKKLRTLNLKGVYNAHLKQAGRFLE